MCKKCTSVLLTNCSAFRATPCCTDFYGLNPPLMSKTWAAKPLHRLSLTVLKCADKINSLPPTTRCSQTVMKRSPIPVVIVIALLGVLSAAPAPQRGRAGVADSNHLSARPDRSDRSASPRRAGPRRIRGDASTRSASLSTMCPSAKTREGRSTRFSGPTRIRSCHARFASKPSARPALLGTDSVTLPGLDVKDEAEVASVLLDVSVLDEEGRYVTRAHARSLPGVRGRHDADDRSARRRDRADDAHAARRHEQQHVVSLRLRAPRGAPARQLDEAGRPDGGAAVCVALGPMTGPTDGPERRRERDRIR